MSPPVGRGPGPPVVGILGTLGVVGMAGLGIFAISGAPARPRAAMTSADGPGEVPAAPVASSVPETGEAARVELSRDRGAFAVVYTGVLVRPDRTPIAGALAWGGFDTGPVRFARTGPYGGFEFAWADLPADRAAGFTIAMHHTGPVPPSRPPPGRRALAVPVRPGVHDLGEIVLPELPLFASGRLVDDVGAVVAGRTCFTRQSDSEGLVILQSASEGRFWIHGDRASGFVELSFRTEHHATRPPCTLGWGERDVRVVIQRFGSIAANLNLPRDDRLRRLLRISLVAAADVQVPPFELSDRGELRYPRLTPGSYRLRIFAAADDEAVVDVAGIQVRPGPTSRDSRLDAIDLGERWRAIELTIVDAAGRPVPEGFVIVTGSQTGDPGPPRHGWAIENGETRLLTAHRAVDLAVHAPGSRVETVRGVTEDTRIRLAPGHPVRFDLAAGVPPGFQLLLAIGPADGERERVRVYRHATGQTFFARATPIPGETARLALGAGDGSVRALFSGPGDYTVQGVLRRHRDGASATLSIRTFRVQDCADEQRVALPWDGAALTAAALAVR